jgi:tetratricopeptide (TPR) repeat protein
VLIQPVSVSPAFAQTTELCVKGSGDAQIAACTKAIASGQWKGRNLAWAFGNRGYGHWGKGDLDRAIADYNEAIRLDPKFAHAYNNRGNAYRDKGDLDRAIADFNETIRLDPKYVFAYNGRGNAYSEKGDLDRPIADYNEAIRLDPKYASAYNGRGNAYSDKGDLDRAIADFNEAIRLDPKLAPAYHNRGRVSLYSENSAKALADFSQASDLAPKYAYGALWLDIAGQRYGVASRLPLAIGQLDMAVWPAPIVRLFLGQLTPAAVLAAADNPDPYKRKSQICEANFYSGVFALGQSAKDEATRLFGLATNGCPRGFIEWSAARSELKALGVTP